MNVRVSGLRVVARPRLAPCGARTVAVFDAHDENFGFQGLRLVRHADGSLKVKAPRLAKRSERRAVYFRAEGEAEGKFLDAAAAAYGALSGETA